MAGKKEAKQKAGPRGQTEKNREETGSSTGAKNTSEEGGQRTAQNTQRKEAHKDLKGQGEPKKPSMMKRRQVRKVATMVKRLNKNPEDGEPQPPAEAGAGLASGDGWDAQQQVTPSPGGCSLGRCCKPLSTQWKKPCAKKRGDTQLARLLRSA